MLIGITGRIASGKGEVAEYLKDKGFVYLSLSQAVREEAGKRGIEITRKNLQDLGNELRRKEGEGVWAKKIIEKISDSDYIIDGLRNPSEIIELKKLKDFFLISVDAPKEIRYKRVVSRDKSSDPKTWEGFLIMDNRDLGEEDLSGQQVGKCMEMADFLIMNDSDLESLNKKIIEIFQKIKC